MGVWIRLRREACVRVGAVQAQDKVLNTLLQSCINADAGPRASMPHNPYDPMATPQQSWYAPSR